jgi:multiple sugar transport system substrate-binding protein
MSRRNRSVARWVALLATAVLVAAACTPQAADDEDGELVWAIGGAEAQPGGTHQQVVEMWNEENPDSPVRIETLPEAADQQREQQALELQAGGAGFDILGVDVIWTGEYAENDWLESLEDIRAEIEEVTLPGPFESATWGGELWAAPYNSNAGLLYYRTDLVDAPPRTWDELCDAGVTVGEQEGIAGLAAQGARYEGFVVNWLEYYWSAGGELYNEDQTEVLFDTEIAAEVTEWLQERFAEGCFEPGFNTAQEEEARTEFQGGNTVFMRNWPYAYELAFEEDVATVDDFDIAPLPTFTGEGTISALGGFNAAVSAFSDDIEGAKEFVLWLSTNEEVQRFLGERSLPPTMASVYEELADDPVMSILGEVLPDAKPRPPAPEWNEISVTIQQEIYPAYNGDRDVQEAVEAVNTFLEGTID